MGLKTPNKIQSQEYSRDGGVDGEQHLTTRLPNRNRLNLGDFDEHGLDCDNWNWDANRNSNLGAFALMMRKNLKRDGLHPVSLV